MTDKELKDLVASLAVDQKENAQRFKETNRLICELRESQQETDQQIRELRKNLDIIGLSMEKSTKDLHRELGSIGLSMEKSTRDLHRELGSIGISIGDSAEEFFFRYFKNHPQLDAWQFSDVKRNLYTSNREYDLVLINGEVVVLASIKQKLENRDIESLRDKEIPAFRQDYPELADHRLYGAVGAMVVGQDKENLAKKNGFYVLTQSGERVEVIVPGRERLKAY